MTETSTVATELISPESAASRPIAEYGLLADCNSAALVARDGLDRLAVPAALRQPDACSRGSWTPTPGTGRSGPPARSRRERRYVARHAGDRDDVRDRRPASCGCAMRWPSPRASAATTSASTRRTRCCARSRASRARWRWRMELAPRPEYGLVKPLFRHEDGGGADVRRPEPHRGARRRSPVEVEDATMRAALHRRARASEVGFALRWAPAEAPRAPEPTAAERVAARIEDTVEAWRSWEAEHDVYEGPHRELVRLSARVLKGLTYRPTGAIVAAPTASLPETVGGERNWDYRFSWIRDSSLTLEALYIGACSDEAEEFVSFMTSSAGGRAGEGSLQIMYGIGGEHDLSERELPHLRGWRDSRAGAGRQRRLEPGPARRLRRAAQRAAPLPRAARRAAPGDPGLRRRPRRHRRAALDARPTRACGRCAASRATTSPRRCCAGPRSTGRSSSRRSSASTPRSSEWAAARDEIRDAILERGWSEKRQAYAQSFDSDELDAAQLLMPILGFLPATDERMRSTIEAIAARSDRGRPGPALPQRGGSERRRADRRGGHVRDLLLLAGLLPGARPARSSARRSCSTSSPATRTTSACWPRRSTPANGEQLGNFPQAYSHIGLIIAAYEIDKARGDERQ